MPAALDILSILLILANLRLLGSSRLAACIRAVALQAVILGAAALIANRGELDARVIAIAVASTADQGGRPALAPAAGHPGVRRRPRGRALHRLHGLAAGGAWACSGPAC